MFRRPGAPSCLFREYLRYRLPEATSKAFNTVPARPNPESNEPSIANTAAHSSSTRSPVLSRVVNISRQGRSTRDPPIRRREISTQVDYLRYALCRPEKQASSLDEPIRRPSDHYNIDYTRLPEKYGRFGQRLSSSASKFAQLLEEANSPDDILRAVVLNVRSQDDVHIFRETHWITRIGLHRFRRDHTDREILSVLNTITWSLRTRGLEPGKHHCISGMKYAVRARSAPAFGLYLTEFHRRNYRWTVPQWQGVVEEFCKPECTMKHGEWDRREAHRILTGWEIDSVRSRHEEKASLSMRSYFHEDTLCSEAYLNTLGVFKASDTIWQEWLDWSTGRELAEIKEGQTREYGASFPRAVLRALLASNDPKRAWQILKSTGTSKDWPSESTWDKLLDSPEYISIWSEETRDAVLRRYAKDLENIESALHIQWVQGDHSHHESIEEVE
ncbi:MAG: hypothetical protein M1827_007217 [Pycnora praestabilis]|nr:MAG: hypothetical protein M1827_007217 [Pycnora praestabilis]